METVRDVRLALPSKGHLEAETLNFLTACGLHVNKTNPRQYSARISTLPQLLLLFQRVRDIPRSVAAADMDLGIAGYDTVVEALGPEAEGVVVLHDDLGFGECELVVAVPETWHWVNDIHDLRAWSQQQPRLRVATKHANLARRFLDAHGLERIEVVTSDGALEAAPAVGYADLIIDLTSTGTTLRDNHLKPLADGTVIRSTAVLIGNRASLQDRPEVLANALHLLEFIEAHQRAAGQYLVFANMRGASAAEVADLMFSQTNLGGLQGPTISPVITRDQAGGWWAVNIVVSARDLYRAVQQLRAIGGSGVVVTPATYIFEECPARAQRLLRSLGKQELCS